MKWIGPFLFPFLRKIFWYQTEHFNFRKYKELYLNQVYLLKKKYHFFVDSLDKLEVNLMK